MKYYARMKLAIMSIGLPGAGKTTLLKPLAEERKLVYISRDDIREEMFGNALQQSGKKEVWEEANRRTAAALQAGKGVVLDSCFVEAWKRHDAIAFLRESGVERIAALFFNVPVEVAKERNARRTHSVQDAVVDWMDEKLKETPPSLSEGFDGLYTLSEIDEFERSELADLPSVA